MLLPLVRSAFRPAQVLLLGACAVVGLAAGCASIDSTFDASSLGGSAGAAGAPVAGSGGASGKGGQAGSSGKAGAASTLEPVGYFDLVFTEVSATLPSGPGEVVPPSHKVPLRVDLPAQPQKGPWVAVVTPRWGQPASFEVTSTEEGLVLKGAANLTETLPLRRVTDVWQTFLLETKGSKLTGKVTGTGQESLVQDELGWSGALSGEGLLSVDSTQPEGRTPLDEADQKGGLLPWEPVKVYFAEPLKSSEATGRLSLLGSESPVAVLWGATKSASEGAVVGLAGYRQSWDATFDSLQLRLSDGFRDPAQNEGLGFEKSLQALVVPPPADAWGVWSSDKLVSWGNAEVVTGDACEGKTCLALGPFEVSACGNDEVGAALRLPSPDGGKPRFRFRVLQSAPSYAEPTNPSANSLLSVEIARPGKAATMVDLASPSVDGATDEGLAFTSAWATAVIPVPDGSGEVGFALRAGKKGALKDCKNAKNTPVMAKILVTTITYEKPLRRAVKPLASV